MYLLFAALLLIVAFGILTHLYNKNWNKKLEVSLRFSTDGIFEGETGEIIETVSNDKLIPLFRAYLQFRVPGPVRLEGTNTGHDIFRQDGFSVFSYEEITKRIRFTAERRGCYRLSDLQLVTGDLRFRYKMILNFPGSSVIYVYPRAKELKRFQIEYEKIIGDAVARYSFLEDPFFFRGIRDYSPFDSMKNINWKATARTGSLMVNQYHTTQARKVMLLLDLDGYNRSDGRQMKEDTISAAAFLARRLTLDGVPAGFVTNAADVLSGGRIETECKSGNRHFFHMMREMAKIDTGSLSVPFDRILETLLRVGDRKTQYLLVSYYYGDELVKRFVQLQAAGLNIRWVYLHDTARGIRFTKRPGMYVCEEAKG